MEVHELELDCPCAVLASSHMCRKGEAGSKAAHLFHFHLIIKIKQRRMVLTSY